jgi:hypothetical protein
VLSAIGLSMARRLPKNRVAVILFLVSRRLIPVCCAFPQLLWSAI